MYVIYKITSPSGKSYTGLTKNSLKERWRQHIKRATAQKYNHPFYNAIRKYGHENFKLEILELAEDKPAAQRAEIRLIASVDPLLRYNLSAGGEADGEYGSRIFWERIKEDPNARAEYIQKLSEAKLKNDWTDYADMSERAAKWRLENPREAWKIQRRASRVAARGSKKTPEAEETLKQRLRWKFKRSEVMAEIASKRAKEGWENKSDETLARQKENARAASKKRWSKVESVEERSALTSKARAGIDRAKQGAAASKGIKSFWAELKKDPVAYKIYIDQRKETLRLTNERKKRDANL